MHTYSFPAGSNVWTILVALPRATGNTPVTPGSRVLIDGGRTTFIDRDVLEAITEFKLSANHKNIEVILEDIEEVEILSKH